MPLHGNNTCVYIYILLSFFMDLHDIDLYTDITWYYTFGFLPHEGQSDQLVDIWMQVSAGADLTAKNGTFLCKDAMWRALFSTFFRSLYCGWFVFSRVVLKQAKPFDLQHFTTEFCIFLSVVVFEQLSGSKVFICFSDFDPPETIWVLQNNLGPSFLFIRST